MNRNVLRNLAGATLLAVLNFMLPSTQAKAAQAAAPPTSQAGSAAPVSYSSASQLNSLLGDLEQSSQRAQEDLSKLRVAKWKTDSNTKHQTESNMESIQRNLQSALPAVLRELRDSPENLTATFKLYRNLDALYDVFGAIVETTGAFGSKDEAQSIENDLSAIEGIRRSLADRMETLTGAKEGELARLHAQAQKAQATEAATPKKVVVDDTAPSPAKKAKKKPSSAKPVPKPPSAVSTPQPQ